MSHLLWKYYWENDVDRFRRLLAQAGPNAPGISRNSAIGSPAANYLPVSPGGLGTSPRATAGKSRKASAHPPTHARFKDGGATLGRNDVNARDHAGLTVLLRASSCTDPNARLFVSALLEHPLIDIYVQDLESGWNALHRSLYAGNASIAQMLLAKERSDLKNHAVSSIGKIGHLIKTKDHEGKSPFDVYNSTIATRASKSAPDTAHSDHGSDSEDSEHLETLPSISLDAHHDSNVSRGAELYVFGSNRNHSLGVGDEDDRQFPERIWLQRPEGLLHRLHELSVEHGHIKSCRSLPTLGHVPNTIRSQPLIIQDVVMAKMHSAIITTDAVSNLYICGVGRGGRLGLGDENTRFKYLSVQGPFADRKVHHIALGQNHSMAVVAGGELWTWGLNSDSQLGYLLPPPPRLDQEPMSTTPRQVFGCLKKEVVQGIAASAIHSVAHTGSSLYCWGRNVGQLALMDADSRSLDVQQTPRKVAASLLSAPISMVSAIDKATACLLANGSVWIFTNYGYNLIKFPFPDAVPVPHLEAISFARNPDPARRDIRYITSAGETIAAITSRGDLFTMVLNQNAETQQPVGSTTNPAKIKGAVTQPQCIWTSRSDGVVSAGVADHGSVIICTESGAVWKRVKRNRGIKAGFASSTGAKNKDFKFERVPYITGGVMARSSAFGAFAAVRRDNSIMSRDISTAEQSLPTHVGALLPLYEFTATEPPAKLKSARQSWYSTIGAAGSNMSSVSREIMRSVKIEDELLNWITERSTEFVDVDTNVRTTLFPNLQIPVHGWILAGRSPVLRQALSDKLWQADSSQSDVFTVESTDRKRLVTFNGLDLVTILNLILYVYQDCLIPVWKYTREAPSEAHRFRQIRLELMKVATKLQMPNLETAARLQVDPKPCMGADFRMALDDSTFFAHSDIVIQLDGAQAMAHSQLLCQRCPFFQGLFNGRSRGQWVSQRRAQTPSSQQVQVDLGHIDGEVFKYVMEFLYADTGPEMFDHVALPTVDDFSELLLDVMSVANELMLDRLSQICQSIIGKLVTTRNIANLLNEISSCSVTEFKNVGLEYICLQLENMLENHLLDGLEDHLLQELDQAVRENQLAKSPFVRSGRADLVLHQKYPELAKDMEEERQRRVNVLASKVQRDENKKLSLSCKARVGSLDLPPAATPPPDKSRRRSKVGPNEPLSPRLHSKDPQNDMIFSMDDEQGTTALSPPSYLASPESSANKIIGVMPPSTDPAANNDGKMVAKDEEVPGLSNMESCKGEGANSAVSRLRTEPHRSWSGGPWAPWTLSTTKLDLKTIMSEVTSTSALTAGIQAQGSSVAPSKPPTRMSQKERKKQRQQQADSQLSRQSAEYNSENWKTVPSKNQPSPWKVATAVSKMSLRDAISSEAGNKEVLRPQVQAVAASQVQGQLERKVMGSPDTRFSGQGRATTCPGAVAGPAIQTQKTSTLLPHSRSYMAPVAKAEPALEASMADIIGQQKRERELAKEAVAKRSLQEIQQEQAFQEWWDQESRRAQEEEARRAARGQAKEKQAGGSRRGRKGKGKAKGSESGGTESHGSTSHCAAAVEAGPSRGGSRVRTKGGSSRL
ncbi:hypothetical protein CDD81_7042 [Ophiocordyceps australis]|uniref:BTB domain-containing protein n=1 Tax=Ophiocordyceps australis TaxID=1399860 RepID=A0A2C5YCW9_9HYPO|nr:hypothetical protein CDD81_7042 [Ophiocordyceps australis]